MVETCYRIYKGTNRKCTSEEPCADGKKCQITTCIGKRDLPAPPSVCPKICTDLGQLCSSKADCGHKGTCEPNSGSVTREVDECPPNTELDEKVHKCKPIPLKTNAGPEAAEDPSPERRGTAINYPPGAETDCETPQIVLAHSAEGQ
jgi:hypothetical protein